MRSAGPELFAAINEREVSVYTPVSVVAAGMVKWLELYREIVEF